MKHLININEVIERKLSNAKRKQDYRDLRTFIVWCERNFSINLCNYLQQVNEQLAQRSQAHTRKYAELLTLRNVTPHNVVFLYNALLGAREETFLAFFAKHPQCEATKRALNKQRTKQTLLEDVISI